MLGDKERERLDRYRAELQQGDVLHVHAFAIGGAPESTTSEETREAQEFAEFAVTTVERRLRTGLWAIVTQTCDIRRDLDVEPFLHLAPIVELDPPAWRAAQAGRGGPRLYSYPPIADIDYPALDVRMPITIEKAALGTASTDPLALRFDPHERAQLSRWLARRYARHAFPDDLEAEVLDALRDSVKARRGKDSEAGALLDCREAILVDYDEAGAVDVRVVINQQRTLAHPKLKGELDRIKMGTDQMFTPVVKQMAKSGSTRTLTWSASYPHAMPYADVLYRFHPLDID